MPFDFPNVEPSQRPAEKNKKLVVINDEQIKNLSVELDTIQVASPCTASWNDMSGDDQVRFCGQCTKNVYNFSDMTRDDIASLLLSTEGRVCGRFFRRSDGTLLTADCPIGLAERSYRMARRSVFAAFAFVAFFITSVLGFLGLSRGESCDTPLVREHQMMGKMMVPATLKNIPQPMMGDMMVPDLGEELGEVESVEVK